MLLYQLEDYLSWLCRKAQYIGRMQITRNACLPYGTPQQTTNRILPIFGPYGTMDEFAAS